MKSEVGKQRARASGFGSIASASATLLNDTAFIWTTVSAASSGVSGVPIISIRENLWIQRKKSVF
jgi:hypothetical protein